MVIVLRAISAGRLVGICLCLCHWAHPTGSSKARADSSFKNPPIHSQPQSPIILYGPVELVCTAVAANSPR